MIKKEMKRNKKKKNMRRKRILERGGEKYKDEEYEK